MASSGRRAHASHSHELRRRRRLVREVAAAVVLVAALGGERWEVWCRLGPSWCERGEEQWEQVLGECRRCLKIRGASQTSRC